MHFFIDHLQLPTQASSNDSFGPFGTTPAEKSGKYDVSAKFKLTAQAKAFACQSGAILVTPCIDPASGTVSTDLVNIILKPQDVLSVDLPAVKYYIYRGIRRDSFFTGSALNTAGSGNTETIKKIWEDRAQILLQIPGTAIPEPKDLGFDLLLNDSQHVEEVFQNTLAPLRTRGVAEGEWIGNFDSADKISFEVIVETELLDVNLGYAKKSSLHRLDVSSMPGFSNPSASPAQAHALRSEREKILAYVDPAAFFGMHYSDGVQVSTYTGTTKSTTTKKKDDIISTFLNKFATSKRVYLDIRSEKGYSYNYYSNYGDANKKLLKLRISLAATASEHTYYTHDWPLYHDDTLVGTSDLSATEIQLRIDDNRKPLLYVTDPKVLGKRNKNLFKDETELLNGAATDWGKAFSFFTRTTGPSGSKVNVATCIRMQYFRQQPVVATTHPNVLKFPNDLDQVFGSIDLKLAITPSVFKHARNEYLGVVEGGEYLHVANTGAYFDSSLFLMYSEAAAVLKDSGEDYPEVNFENQPPGNIISNSVFPKDVGFNKWKIEETANNFVSIIDLTAFSRGSKSVKIDQVFFLGLTMAEIATLQQTPGLSLLHGRYLTFEQIPNSGDVLGRPYKKYKLKLQGLDANGAQKVVDPITNVFVYSGGSEVFCSKDFASAVNITTILPDPGLMTEWKEVGKASYDKTDPTVLAYSSGGIIVVDDRGSDHRRDTYEIELRGEYFFPIDNRGETLPSPRHQRYPLVVIVHGNGHKYTNYKTLANHLARNGFIVAAIDITYLDKQFPMLPTTTYPNYDFDIETPFDTYVYNSVTKKIAKLVYLVEGLPPVPSLLDWQEGRNFFIIAGTPQLFEVGTRETRFHGLGALSRTQVLYAHLNILNTKLGPRLQNNIGLIGHSRGGEAVVKAGQEIGSTVPATLNNIQAIISLAPTDRYEKESLVKNIPYFVLYGSKDTDVSGYIDDVRRHLRSGPTPNPAQPSGSGAFSLYDRASNNTKKAMAFVYGANHNGFITSRDDDPGANSNLSNKKQKMAAKAYFNAFLRHTLKLEPIWNAYLDGTYIPGSIHHDEIYMQYQDMGSPYLVDTFEEIANNWAFSSPHGLIHSLSALTTPPVQGKLSPHTSDNSIDTKSPHDTGGLLIDTSPGGKIIFKAAATSVDVSGRKFLSIRMCHMVNSSASYPDTSKIELAIADTGTGRYSQPIPKRLPKPDKRSDKERIKSALMTLRIPLTVYQSNGVDLARVQTVELIFPSPGVGKIEIDSLEFTL
jgi:Chlorophyllase enzyme